ncbi:rod shape-determining protein MreD [Alphaproteobacteria bacterium]|nr:rod shape-determining protein MreD [Alphaproteobacteria bacterium]
MSPYPTAGEIFQKAFRMVLPYSLIVVLFVWNVISLSNIGAVLSGYPLVLITLYYWFLYRPTLIPLWLTFVIGIIMDALTGVPLGLNTLIFVLLRLVITDQRRFLMAQTFPVVWLIFCVILVAYHVIQWLLQSFVLMTILPWHDLGTYLIGSVMLFPLLTLFLHLTHKMWPVSGVQSKMDI